MLNIERNLNARHLARAPERQRIDHKPFECVGDPDESAVALKRVSELEEWADVAFIGELAALASPDRDFNELLEREGTSRVPAHWFR